jgi:hypothetical protein
VRHSIATVSATPPPSPELPRKAPAPRGSFAEGGHERQKPKLVSLIISWPI